MSAPAPRAAPPGLFAPTAPAAQRTAPPAQPGLFAPTAPAAAAAPVPAIALAASAHGAAQRDEAARVAAMDWPAIEAELNEFGCALLPGLLSPAECARLAASYAEPALFRSRVVMQRHGFGKGEYQYFTYPLPVPVAALRRAFYQPLAAIANRWQAALGLAPRFPAEHSDYLARCHAAGQPRPTPLLLQYRAGDYNCLHQDLYGDEVFPLQVAVLLSQPGEDFDGGQFVLTEQRPRMQSRAEVVPLTRGDAVVFPVAQRPVSGGRGVYRVNMRHGVSRLLSGRRHTLGLIFHDAS